MVINSKIIYLGNPLNKIKRNNWLTGLDNSITPYGQIPLPNLPRVDIYGDSPAEQYLLKKLSNLFGFTN